MPLMLTYKTYSPGLPKPLDDHSSLDPVKRWAFAQDGLDADRISPWMAFDFPKVVQYDASDSLSHFAKAPVRSLPP